jgi:hypothetical protein
MARSNSIPDDRVVRPIDPETFVSTRFPLSAARSRREVLGVLAAATAAVGLFSNSKAAWGALPNHPRLYLNSAGFQALPALASASAFGTSLAKSIQSRAKYKLSLPPVAVSDFSDPAKTDSVVEKALSRAYIYGIANALQPNPAYVSRAIQECLTCCSLSSWYPTKFIGVAAMAQYVATVYDWFFSSLTLAQVATIRKAVNDKAFVPYMGEVALNPQPYWLTSGATDWNIACNGGIGVAALTFYNEIINAPAVLKQTLGFIKLGFANFGPDGGWFEGPKFWASAATYAINYLAAFHSAGLTAGTLLNSPGFSNTGSFATQMTGPTGKVFNFGDSDDSNPRVPELEWLAQTFSQPTQSYSEITSTDHIEGMNLGWFTTNQAPPQTPPLNSLFASANLGVASFRSAFANANAAWLAMKGGTNGLRHGDLDLGTFCIDALGQRFAMDLGPDVSTLAGYFDTTGPRYQYYRTGSIGQNVLLSGRSNQAITATAPVLAFHTSSAFSRVVYDLSNAYVGLHHKRGGGLISNNYVVISDEVTPGSTTQLTWQMHTQATITITNNVASLALNGAVLYAHILRPAQGAVFAIASAAAPAPQNPNTGIKKLIVKWAAPAGVQRLVIVLGPTPTVPSAVATTALIPLGKW